MSTMSPKQSKFCSVNLGWNRSVAVPWGKKSDAPFFDSELVSLLCSKVDEVGSHTVLLTTPQLIHTESLVENTTGSEVLVGFRDIQFNLFLPLSCAHQSFHRAPPTSYRQPGNILKQVFPLCPNLVLQPMLLAAVLLDLGVDVLHQSVPLHQHVREGGTGEDTHHLGTNKKSEKRQRRNRKKILKQIPLS